MEKSELIVGNKYVDEDNVTEVIFAYEDTKGNLWFENKNGLVTINIDCISEIPEKYTVYLYKSQYGDPVVRLNPLSGCDLWEYTYFGEAVIEQK